MKIRLILSFIIISALIFHACKTDFDINATWKESTIVYGILNQNDSVQYFKINKAFLGEGNAMFMAQNPDSSTYGDKIEVLLYEYNGVNLEIIPLDTVTIDNKDSGIFYYPRQILYKTSHPLNELFLYKIFIRNKISGKIITSDSIPLIQGTGFRLDKPFGSFIEFTKVPPYEPKLIFKTPKYGKRYQIIFRFHYSETNISTLLKESKYVDWNLGEKKSTSLSGGETIELSYGEQFFNILKGAIRPNSDVTRMADSVKIIVYVAGDDLSTYMDVNSPSSSIVQERPEYSNIINGIGIFSCRYNLRKKFILSVISRDSLSHGRFTNELGFK